MMKSVLYFLILSSLLLISCARSPLKDPVRALRLSAEELKFRDDLDFKSLHQVLSENISHLRIRPEEFMRFGPYQITQAQYADELETLLKDLPSDEEQAKQLFFSRIQTSFDVLEVYGTKDWSEIFMTAYFEPMIQGRRKKTEKFSRPLYKAPEDLVTIDYQGFLEIYPKLKPEGVLLTEQKSAQSVLRGRLTKMDNGRPLVVPYYDRKEIDVDEKLKGMGLEMVYVDPIDSFFLQIQGSGVVQLEDGKLFRVGYSSQNGHPYVPIGKFLFDVIPREKMSMQAIETHLRSLPPEAVDELLNENPSYVFFTELEDRSITSFGSPTVPGRTVATDRSFFPKGALAYLVHEMPEFTTESEEPIAWNPSHRIVVDQDTGGAIRGPGRLDLYLGLGEMARRSAGVMKRDAKLYYFFPKSFLRTTAQTP